MDKTSIVNEWLDFANKDISSAKYLLDMRPVPLEIICYHCEQAAEKALKGYLILHDMELDSDMQEAVIEADLVMGFILEKIKSLDAV
ncbi:hypothetical protein SBF1_5970006 [Candidatus Desulfosporosinus infrequens]|uniref:HEPN domain-containing protein n=1 Tax=Candidatus Desulfosporosinus infrequens TaxID=2043169 RepID=A0A2U3LLC0_9FIRM|nr:hypothetical protein SBF1_5970006 [Candidatus Desulfosporosinus infrequens]